METRERIISAYNQLKDVGIISSQQNVADRMGIRKKSVSKAFNGCCTCLHPFQRSMCDGIRDRIIYVDEKRQIEGLTSPVSVLVQCDLLI